MMVGSESINDFRSRGQSYGFGNTELNLGHAKMILTRTTGTLFPSREQLEVLVSEAHEAGFPVAIHAVEAEAAEAAVHALACANKPELRNLIEHCSECPPQLVKKLRQSGISVIAQPSFLYFSGHRHLQDDQALGPQAPLPRKAATSRVFLQRLGSLGPQGLKGGQQAEDEAGREGQSDAEEPRAGVEPGMETAGESSPQRRARYDAVE